MDQIVIRRRADRPVVAIRHEVPADMLAPFIGGALQELYEFAGAAGIDPEGPPSARYHAVQPDVIDVEVCLPVAPGTIGVGRIREGVIPAAEVATLEFVGPYDGIGAAHGALARWAEEHGHAVAGPPLERYLVGPDVDVPPAEYRTQVDLPIVPAAVAQRG
jgi:effector-binding domain-containing protein